MAGTFVTDSAAVNPFSADTQSVASSVTNAPVREVVYPKGQSALEAEVTVAVAGTGTTTLEVWAADVATDSTTLGSDKHRVASLALRATAGVGGAIGDRLTVPFYSNKRYLQVVIVANGTVSAGTVRARYREQNVNRKRAGQPA